MLRPWTLDSEMQYRKFIENAGAAEFIANKEEAEDVIDDHGSTVENETYLHYTMQNLYKTERNAYCILKQLQGKRIPQLICTLEDPVISGLAPQSIQEHTAILGLLLQHIDGVHLSDLSVYSPQSHWQPVCDQALNTTNKIADEGVMDMYVKPRNFMVVKTQETGLKSSCLMLGYAIPTAIAIITTTFGNEKLQRVKKVFWDRSWKEI